MMPLGRFGTVGKGNRFRILGDVHCEYIAKVGVFLYKAFAII
jgi:hypothetical protein